MRSGNLFNLIRDRVNTSQLNSIYTLVTGFDAFSEETDNEADENPTEPAFDVIRCNWTACRLRNSSEPVPDDIEKCQ